jgi:hypothetical protein
VLEDLKLPAHTFNRRHASSLDDLVKAIAEKEYAIVQFSGHGSKDGIYLESGGGRSGQLITASRIASLLSEAQPNLKLAIFMSCYSAEALPVLIKAAPYLLTIFGPADDAASIHFITGHWRKRTALNGCFHGSLNV